MTVNDSPLQNVQNVQYTTSQALDVDGTGCLTECNFEIWATHRSYLVIVVSFDSVHVPYDHGTHCVMMEKKTCDGCSMSSHAIQVLVVSRQYIISGT